MRRVPQLIILTAAVMSLCAGQALAQRRPVLQRSPVPQKKPVLQQSPVSPPRTLVIKYTFGARTHVDRLATSLHQQANAICWEMHKDYQHNAGYALAYREMYTIKEGTKKIQAMTGQAAGRHSKLDDRIVRELNELDRQFHKFQTDLRHWRARSGGAASRRELHVLMAECEETLHHLMEDYGVRTTIAHR